MSFLSLRHPLRLGLFVLAMMALVAVGLVALASGDEVYLGRRVPAGQLVPIDRVDHGAWNQLLRRFVDRAGNVDYRGWQQDRAGMQALDRYLDQLSQADPRQPTTRNAAMAYWINAYNAVTIRGILREYPTTSIRNHTSKIVGYNIWDDLLLYVGNQPYSLNQMEHEVLRKMGDPRIHFAIVCASASCPRLPDQAYTAELLDAQLDENARHFFSQPGNFAWDARQGTIRLSSILKWFGRDFGSDVPSQLATIARWLPDPAARQMAQSGQARVSYLNYDWSLNDQETRR